MSLGLYGKTFTVINATDQAFQDLFAYYKAMGIHGHEIVAKAVYDIHFDLSRGESKSSFNPALMDMLTTWFTQPGDWVLDPFAGGPVRGLVSGVLGRNYLGVDIRAEQIELNRSVAARLAGRMRGEVQWAIGDSAVVMGDVDIVPQKPFRHIITCPPYFDLEEYGGPEGDLSGMGRDEFIEAYRKIIHGALSRLSGDGFSVWVVGNVRFGDFVEPLDAITTQIHREAGYELYNDICFLTPIATAAYRAQVLSRRLKMVRVHQMVMVYATRETVKRIKSEHPRNFAQPKSNEPTLF